MSNPKMKTTKFITVPQLASKLKVSKKIVEFMLNQNNLDTALLLQEHPLVLFPLDLVPDARRALQEIRVESKRQHQIYYNVAQTAAKLHLTDQGVRNMINNRLLKSMDILDISPQAKYTSTTGVLKSEVDELVVQRKLTIPIAKASIRFRLPYSRIKKIVNEKKCGSVHDSQGIRINIESFQALAAEEKSRMEEMVPLSKILKVSRRSRSFVSKVLDNMKIKKFSFYTSKSKMAYIQEKDLEKVLSALAKAKGGGKRK